MNKYRRGVFVITMILGVGAASLGYSAVDEQQQKSDIRIMAEKLYQSSNPDSKLKISTRIYNISVPLIATKVIADPLYHTINNDMRTHIDEVKPLSMQAWILGRMLLAANLATIDEQDVIIYKKKLEMLLQSKELKKDIMAAWATAYLAAYDKATYRHFDADLHTHLDQASAKYISNKSPETLTNLMWIITMNLYAAAETGDAKGYREYVNAFTKSTEMESLTKAISDMPTEDYKAWLLSLNMLAAKKMDDEHHYTICETLLEATLLDQKTKDADKMIAMATQMLERSLTNHVSQGPTSRPRPNPRLLEQAI